MVKVEWQNAENVRVLSLQGETGVNERTLGRHWENLGEREREGKLESILLILNQPMLPH